jgi:phage terminase large subunit
MSAQPAISPDDIAAATYAAMFTLPAYAELAAVLDATADDDARLALLDAADDATRAAALRYIASSRDSVERERKRRLTWMRQDVQRVGYLKLYYAQHVADFINDWGYTIDPRLVARGKSPSLAFSLFPRQRELIDWTLERWRRGETGVVVKSRDVGASWVAMAVLGTLCIFCENFAAGIASATEIKLDRSGDPDTLFYKLRAFLEHLPPEFNGGWTVDKHSAYLRVSFPETNSSVTGEAGDQAGRGGRKSLYIVDEAAHFEHPKLIDASLAATTDCRIDMSSVNGTGNSFYEKAHNAAIPRFDFSWRDDPRKDDAWYARKAAELDPVIVAQEIDCNFAASFEGVVIPSAWVQAAVGLAERLGIEPTGARRAALDVADRGVDKNAFAIVHGIELEHVESWSGKDSDIFGTTARAFRLCDEHALTGFDYDADGLGAGVRGDARVLNEKRTERDPRNGQVLTQAITVNEYRGSASPMHPEKLVPRTNRKNEDFYANRKAQSWWTARFRFGESFKASQGMPFDREAIVSINPRIPELSRLIAELSQATVKETASGKLQIEKTPDSNMSPNLADAVVMSLAPRKPDLGRISAEILRQMGVTAVR